MIDGGRRLHILDQILDQYKVVQRAVSPDGSMIVVGSPLKLTLYLLP
jgi:hypothetical protein